MIYYVYVIKNKEGKTYIGQTDDLLIRLEKHNNNKNFYTKNKGPWRLVYKEEYKTRAEAMKREKFLKTGHGRDFLKKISFT